MRRLPALVDEWTPDARGGYNQSCTCSRAKKASGRERTRFSACSPVPGFPIQPAWFPRRNARPICSIALSTDRSDPSGHLESILSRRREKADFNSPSSSEAVVPESSAPSRSCCEASSPKSLASCASLCASLYTSSLDCNGASRVASRIHGLVGVAIDSRRSSMCLVRFDRTLPSAGISELRA